MKMKNAIPEVDAYVDRAPDFARPILRRLRGLFHQACPEIEETIKWSSPFFEYKGIVGNMTAFKQHVSYGFWKAALMSDPEGLLENAGNTEMAVLKARTLDDLPADEILLSYIKEAVALNEKGIKAPRSRPKRSESTLAVPDFFIAAVRENDRALATFESFSYSNRKEYVEWVTEAKRPSTRERRLAQTVEWLAEGKPRNWKYMRNWR